MMPWEWCLEGVHHKLFLLGQVTYLIDSMRWRLFCLPEVTKVFPGTRRGVWVARVFVWQNFLTSVGVRQDVLTVGCVSGIARSESSCNCYSRHDGRVWSRLFHISWLIHECGRCGSPPSSAWHGMSQNCISPSCFLHEMRHIFYRMILASCLRLNVRIVCESDYALYLSFLSRSPWYCRALLQ